MEPGSDVEATVQRKVHPQVRQALAENGTVDFWVNLTARADLTPAFAMTDWTERGWFVYETLRTTAEKSQQQLTQLLDEAGVEHESFWVKNTIWVRNGGETLLNRLAARTEVSHVSPTVVYALPEPEPAAAAENTLDSVEWGISDINAPDVWDTYTKGAGMVVANIDTGVAYTHEAVNSQYRGNSSGSYDHDYNWYDPTGNCSGTAPCDNNDHGTHTMGTMVGDDGGDNQIGVAPEAKWIAAKGCGSSTCTDTALLSAGQWLIAPTDSDGRNADPDMRPNVVNNSWGGSGGDNWYADTVDSWIAAGIFPAFSNGNSGSSCRTSSSPGDYIESYSSGAHDSSGSIASFSSRGPSSFSSELKPNISAPGVSVRSSVAGGGYASYSGTSMASPHTAGAVALIWAAAPALVGDIDGTRQILDETAVDVSETTCGGTSDDNNVWGEGKLDVLAAVEMATGGMATGTLAGTVTDSATGSGISGATVAVGSRTATTDSNGAYSMEMAVGRYDATASASGYLSSTSSVTISEGVTSNQDFSLEESAVGSATFNSTYQTPACTSLAAGCDSGDLLHGRDSVGDGEPNQPNTLYDSCADGTSGTYHDDESVDRIVVSTADGGDFAAGKVVNVEVTVWAYSFYTSDSLDLYYTADATASSPRWTSLGTLSPSASGEQVLTTSYTLPSGAVQAVRANFRYEGSASPCSTGSYDDHDDLVFAVGEEDGGGDDCTTIYSVDFDSNAGDWAFSSDDSTCTTGDWGVGDPDYVSNDGVVTQLEDDHTASGVKAFFTEPNTGGAGTDDVDGGVCTGYSGVINANGYSEVELSLWYYHGQRDARDDSDGDYFRIDLSTDGGITFGQSLVSIGDITSNAAWTQVTTTVSNPDQLVIRVQAADGSREGDLVEGGIDDIEICARE